MKPHYLLILLILLTLSSLTPSLAQLPKEPLSETNDKSEAYNPPITPITPMLPQVEYQGPIERRGLPDLRLGVALYEQYHNFINQMPTHLLSHDITKNNLEIKERINELLQLQGEDLLESIKFTFPNGVRILCIPKEKIIIVEDNKGKLTPFVITEKKQTRTQRGTST